MLTFFRNYFTIMGVNKGHRRHGDRILAETENPNAPPLKTFFQKNLTKNTAYGIINNV